VYIIAYCRVFSPSSEVIGFGQRADKEIKLDRPVPLNPTCICRNKYNICRISEYG